MEAENNHIRIDSVAWEIIVNNRAQAETWQDFASQFTREKMLPFMEQVLAGENSKGQLLRIDKLEMEFRHINNLDDLEREFKSSFREAWRKANANRSILNTGQNKEGNISSVDPLKQFQFYLEAGYLEWESDKQFIDDPALMFDWMYQSEPEKIRDWITRIRLNPNAVMRFIDYFTTGQLNLLYTTHNPALPVFENAESILNNLFEKSSQAHLHALAIRSLLGVLIFNPNTDTSYIVRQWWRDLSVSMAEKERLEKEILGWDFSIMPGLPEQRMEFINELKTIIETSKKKEPNKNLIRENESQHMGETPGTAARAHFIENAGLILLYPYIRQLLLENSLIDEKGDFRDARDQMQSCYLLQYIITGDPQVKEYHLLLNKVLLGYPIEMAVTRTWDPDKANAETANSFLREVLKNWPKLETTSIEGFRNSFLIREGKLLEESNNWILYVERKGWDVLLETLPYPLSIIKLPWMTKPLYVQW